MEGTKEVTKKKNKSNKILVQENKNTKKLIIIMLFAIFTGFITPIGETPFTYMIKQMENSIVSNINQTNKKKNTKLQKNKITKKKVR